MKKIYSLLLICIVLIFINLKTFASPYCQSRQEQFLNTTYQIQRDYIYLHKYYKTLSILPMDDTSPNVLGRYYNDRDCIEMYLVQNYYFQPYGLFNDFLLHDTFVNKVKRVYIHEIGHAIEDKIERKTKLYVFLNKEWENNKNKLSAKNFNENFAELFYSYLIQHKKYLGYDMFYNYINKIILPEYSYIITSN